MEDSADHRVDSGALDVSGGHQGGDGRWLDVDILVEADQWNVFPEAEELAVGAARALAGHARFAENGPAEACIALADDAAVCALNSRFRGKNKPTNVLSFPAPAVTGHTDAPEGPLVLGDIVIAFETVAREAEEQGVPLGHHIQHLVVHGLLHLLGFDHEVEADALAMEGLEIEILACLGIADPYTQEVIANSS